MAPHPMITTALLCGLGDVLSQTIDSQRKFDIKSTMRNMIYGGIIFAPIGSRWYPLLKRIKISKNEFTNTMARVAIDQFCWAPIGVGLYFTSIGIMEGHNLSTIKQKLETVYFKTLLTNWCVWPLFQTANFQFVAVQYQLVAVNVASVIWNSFLSWQNARSLHPQP